MHSAAHRFVLPLGLAACASLASCSRSGGSGPVPGPAPSVETGDPILAPRTGYVGSGVCAPCHREIFDTWSATVHATALRATDRPGVTGETIAADSNGDGVDDFRAGLDLASVPAFAAFGANAPRLSFRAGAPLPDEVTIGPLTYPVERTYGGNGLWKELFVTRIGRSHFVLPIQWNDASRAWVPYEPERWYDAAHQPLFLDAAALVATIDPASSFEQRCSGCHHLGLELAVEPSGASSEVVAGYLELSNGCESCHGPGATHVARGGGFGSIVNPRGRIDGSAEGLGRADETCGRCHASGTGDPIAAGGPPVEFPWSAASGGFEAGDDLSDFLRPPASDADWWGRNDVTGQFVASRAAYPHWLDKENGVHASSLGTTPSCFDCHDPHRRPQRHQLRETVTWQGVSYRTRPDDDSLCLACHHGATERRDFRTVGDDDVRAIASSGIDDAIRAALVRHLANLGMPVSGPAAIDPAGPTRVGHCITCHMPLTASTAETHADAAGFVEGELHDHSSRPIHPNVSFETGVTNSCSASGCHPLATVPNDPAWTVIDEWGHDGPDDDGNFHAATPLASETGRTGGGRPCAECHTTEGFLRTRVEGGTLDDATAASLVETSIGRHQGITCQACHGNAPASTAPAESTRNLRFPVRDVCVQCHTVSDEFEAFANAGGVVRHPQFQMLSGTGGGEVSGQVYDDSYHTIFTDPFQDQCATCHVADVDGNHAPFRERTDHKFEPKYQTCVPCHSEKTGTRVDASTGIDPMARADYDGNGKIDSVQSETLGLVDVLRFAVLDHDPRLELDADFHFAFMGSTAAVNRTNGFDDVTLRAIYDVYFVENDKSKGMHNTAYAVELLQRSYRELTGMDVPGASPWTP
jgi:decaheme cytochrome c component MtrC/MtrF-like protein/doubled CXXCH motif protein